MPENIDPEYATIDGPSETSTEAELSSLEDSSIDGLTRFGPGAIEGLRFKWSVRRVPEGYVVDETIGASKSAFTTDAMSREATLAFLNAREAEARQRFEALRQKFVDAQYDVATKDLRWPKAEEALEVIKTPPLAAAASQEAQATSSNRADNVIVDDVMDRIARLLDER